MTIQSKQTRGQKAVVLYYSHKGKTARYAREIAMYLWSKGLSVSLSAVTDYDPARLGEADFLITGCRQPECGDRRPSRTDAAARRVVFGETGPFRP